MQGIGRRSFLFGKPRVLGRLGEVVGFDMSRHPSGLEGRAGCRESTAVSALLEEPAPGSAFSARRLPSSTSELEAFGSSSSSRTIESSTPRQRKLGSDLQGRVVELLASTTA